MDAPAQPGDHAGMGSDILKTLRSGGWLTARRRRVLPRLLLAVNLAVAIAWIAASLPAGVDPAGKAIGTDFTSFWAAGKLALAGEAASAYDPARHYAVQREAFAGAPIGFAAFFYPPTFLLLCLPLGMLPYFAALLAWLGATGAACARAVRALRPAAADWVVLLAFPAVLLNAEHGQNGFLTAALLAAGVALLDRRPVLAGIAFGALVVKPQLALMLPLLVIARGRWSTLAAASATALVVCLAATMAFGAGIWTHFLSASSLARASLEQGLVGFDRMQSVFAAVRLLGGNTALAWVVQAMSGIAAGAAVLVVARRSDPGIAGAAAVTATLLATPFLLDYDLMALAIPLAVLSGTGHRAEFLPWEKTVLCAAYVWPFLARPLAMHLHVPLTPVLVALVLALAVRRSASPPA
jgi:alpha-1,2-mannosyltransferase